MMLQKLEHTEHTDRSWNRRWTATCGSKAQLGTGIMARFGSIKIMATERRSARKRRNYGDSVSTKNVSQSQERRQQRNLVSLPLSSIFFLLFYFTLSPFSCIYPENNWQRRVWKIKFVRIRTLRLNRRVKKLIFSQSEVVMIWGNLAENLEIRTRKKINIGLENSIMTISNIITDGNIFMISVYIKFYGKEQKSQIRFLKISMSAWISRKSYFIKFLTNTF